MWSSLVARAKLLLQLETYALKLEIVVNLQVEANIANAARKVAQNTRQAKCCANKKEKEYDRQFMLNALGDFEHMMSNQEVQRMAFQILDYIFKTLHPCPSPKSMKEVMENVLSHPRLKS